MSVPSGTFMDSRSAVEYGGFLCLEELDGVDVQVVNATDDGAKVVSFKVRGLKE